MVEKNDWDFDGWDPLSKVESWFHVTSSFDLVCAVLEIYPRRLIGAAGMYVPKVEELNEDGTTSSGVAPRSDIRCLFGDSLVKDTHAALRKADERSTNLWRRTHTAEDPFKGKFAVKVGADLLPFHE